MEFPRLKTALLLAFLAALALPAAAAAAQPGDLDASFGDGGVAVSSVRQFKVSAPAVAVAPDGRITVASTISTEPPGSQLHSGYYGTEVRISRFLPDGRPDPAFGQRGTAALSLGPNGTEVRDIALTSGGGVVVAGRTSYRTEMPECCTYIADWDLAVAGLDSGGELVWLAARDDGMSGVATAVAVDASGGVLAGGSSGVRRFHASGLSDSSFGIDGIAPGPDRVADIAVEGDRILVAGSRGGAPQLARLDGGGGTDASYGQGGIAPLPGQPLALAGDGDGRSLVLGLRSGGPYVARLDSTGAADPGFGDAGAAGVSQRAMAIAVDASGRTIVGMYGGRVVRLAEDGSRDGAFRSARTPARALGAVAVGPDGKVLAAGVVKTFATREGGWRDRYGAAVTRYHAEAASDSSRPAKRRRAARTRVSTGPHVARAAKAAG